MATPTRTRITRLFTFFVSVFVPVLVVQADDTQIYLAADSDGDSRSQYESNILFVIDTSGSMDEGIIGAYDPNTDYIQELDDLGIPHTCERGKLYFDTDNETGDAIPHKANHGCNEEYIHESRLQCAEAYDRNQPFSLEEQGYWFGIVQQYDAADTNWQSVNEDDSERGFSYACWSENGRINADGDPEYMTENTVSGFSTNQADQLDPAPTHDYTLFTANYMAWYYDYVRIKVLNKVFKESISSLNTGNVGVMRFSHDDGGQGGMVVHAMDHISGTKDVLTDLADEHFKVETVSGATPLAETMWEAYNYYSGSEVDTGNDSEPITSVPESRVGGSTYGSRYQTPIQKACQKNFIVYLSDGEADADEERDEEIRELTGSSCSYETGDDCLDDLAAWMSENDITPDIGAGTDDWKQTVTTHTIGFGVDSTLLESAAARSGGRYFSANSASQLKAAFADILREVITDSGSFTPPAVSVNAFSRLMHRNDLYFTLFKPSLESHWVGNLKKYKLAKVGGAVQIVDANSAPAINALDGQFRDTARSFWTPAGETDGDDITKGGAAGQLSSVLQNNQSRPRTALDSIPSISNAANAINENNKANITKAILDIESDDDAYHTDLLKWIRGVDVNDHDGDTDTNEHRRQLGDPLHTQPVVVTYGGTDADPDITVFVTTNDGFLHAFDSETGEEQIAYIPADILEKQKLAFDETLSSGKLYGLDGSITTWVKDANLDGTIEEGSDHVYLYVGMRRGGKSYYALDVTDRANPKLMWQIKQDDTDFASLGQTWSKPFLGRIKIGADSRNVLIFAGGFDDGGADTFSEDDPVSPAAHDIGNAIYIVDAVTGDLLYTASNRSGAGIDEFADMDFAIPSDIAVLDINGDTYHDRMYVGDLGGQLWRFDINNGSTGAGLVDGTVIAKLGRTATGAGTTDYRRFFNRPDVALIVDELNGTFLSIAIGSGRRNEPTDKDIQDRFFSIWDKNVYSTPATYPAAIDEEDLHDATDNLVSEGDATEQSTARSELAVGNGWFIDLEHGDAGMGEKSLATAITVDNQILFTTYVPSDSADPDSCDAGIGGGRFYLVKVNTAEPATHYEFADSGETQDPTKNDRSKYLASGGIPPSPIVLFPEANNGEMIVLNGTEIEDIPLRQRSRKTYWYMKED